MQVFKLTESYFHGYGRDVFDRQMDRGTFVNAKLAMKYAEKILLNNHTPFIWTKSKSGYMSPDLDGGGDAILKFYVTPIKVITKI